MAVNIVVAFAFIAILSLYGRLIAWRCHSLGMDARDSRRLVWMFVSCSIIFLTCLAGLSTLYRVGLLGVHIALSVAVVLLFIYLLVLRRVTNRLR